MTNSMKANELKTKGISALETHLVDSDEIIITVRGQQKHVVMTLDEYAKYRDYELELALAEAKADVQAGPTPRCVIGLN